MNAPLLATPYSTITWDAKHSVARIVRSELAYLTIEDIERDGIEVQRTLEKAGKIRLLVDLRAVMPRNDPSFELAIARFRRKVLGGGQQVAILVKTAMGALQVMRHMREDGFPAQVFTEEAAALAFLATRPSEHTPTPARLGRGSRSRPAPREVSHHVG